ncbi:hypothetical protein [Ochrovirga pacifica]|uniref:hypothetical protein n=1 Tax=Ochrovirga pacifica TaxID=1042376 RepID=UPI000255A84B|nr:hypothetical protein [Ochrovirga pacifica]
MDCNEKIESLLEKYYLGETSLEEEKKLKELLLTLPDDSKFELEKEMFSSYNQQEEELVVPSSLETDTISVISEQSDKKVKIRKLLWIPTTIAASWLLFMMFYKQPEKETLILAEIFNKEQEAYNTTKETLFYVSKVMNSELGKISRLDKMEQHLSPLSYLDRIDTHLKE